jgi:molybdopterin converting factor small subunit
VSQVRIRLPAALRGFCEGKPEVLVRAVTVGQALQVLQQIHPAVGARILDPDGRLRRHVNIFVGEVNIRDLGGLDTPLLADQLVSVIPAVAGG